MVVLCVLGSAESRTDRKEPVYAGKTPSSPLSPTAQRLLTEFGLRYGVVSNDRVPTWSHVITTPLPYLHLLPQGELYRRIVYLEYLAK